jgi:hypothetical protein
VKAVLADLGYEGKATMPTPDACLADGQLLVSRPAERRATVRSYLMCPPAYFAVTYAINPWMRPDQPTNPNLRRVPVADFWVDLRGCPGPVVWLLAT